MTWEEGSASDVGATPQVPCRSSLQPLPPGVVLSCRDQRCRIAGGRIGGLGICHSAAETLISFSFSFFFLPPPFKERFVFILVSMGFSSHL